MSVMLRSMGEDRGAARSVGDDVRNTPSDIAITMSTANITRKKEAWAGIRCVKAEEGREGGGGGGGVCNGGRYWTRTSDPIRVKDVL